MKERLLDIIKWGLILIIAGAIFYLVCHKYYFLVRNPKIRCNKITGNVEGLVGERWISLKGNTQYPDVKKDAQSQGGYQVGYP